MPRTRKYLFGRINIIGRPESKETLLRTLMSSNVEYEDRGHIWGIFEQEEISIDGVDYATGELVKVVPRDEWEHADRSTHTLATEVLEDRTKAKARFFMRMDQGLLAYHRDGGDITASRFRNVFAELLEKSSVQGLMMEAFVQPVKDEADFFEMLGKFTRIGRVRITLNPTNPTSRPEYRDIDDLIKRAQAETYKQEFATEREEGIDVSEPELHSGFVMSADGYGESKVDGEINGEERSVSTGDDPSSEDVPTDIEEPKSILGDLVDKFHEIASRTEEE